MRETANQVEELDWVLKLIAVVLHFVLMLCLSIYYIPKNKVDSD